MSLSKVSVRTSVSIPGKVFVIEHWSLRPVRDSAILKIASRGHADLRGRLASAAKSTGTRSQHMLFLLVIFHGMVDKRAIGQELVLLHTAPSVVSGLDVLVKAVIVNDLVIAQA